MTIAFAKLGGWFALAGKKDSLRLWNLDDREEAAIFDGFQPGKFD